jgi:hypothetical protein
MIEKKLVTSIGFLVAFSGLACSERMRDRIVVEAQSGQEEPYVPLRKIELKTPQDFQTLDKWLSEGKFAEDAQKVYGNLLRLFPDDPNVAGHAGLALFASGHDRARDFAMIVLERFKERIEETPVLQELRDAVGAQASSPEGQSRGSQGDSVR